MSMTSAAFFHRPRGPLTTGGLGRSKNSAQVDGARLRKMVGGGERWVNLEEKIPVHITYFTAWVDESGVLQTRNDIYGHDKRVAKALGLN